MFERRARSADRIDVRQMANRVIGGGMDMLIRVAALPFSRSILVDIFETAEAYRIDISLPGVDPDDVVVTATDTTLTIQVPAQPPRAVGSGSYVRRERHPGRRMRTITFAEALDVGRITCTYRQGVLTVLAPKKTGKKIPIQVPATAQIEVPAGQKVPSNNSTLMT
jgi:HSP20 family molecular chaperone IbpA